MTGKGNGQVLEMAPAGIVRGGPECAEVGR